MPLRDDFATCPQCAIALDPRADRDLCNTCGGTWITEAALLALLAQLAPNLPPSTLRFETLFQPGPARTCARCPATMTQHELCVVAVDRCAEHGVWFDAKELEATLRRAGLWDLDHAPVGTRAGRAWDRFTRFLVVDLLGRG